MKQFELKDIQPDDLDELLGKIEASFDMKFVRDESSPIETFGQLCDHITNKMHLNNVSDCTSQQAFYKLREAISSTQQIENKIITTDYLLHDLYPRKSRRSKIRKLEKQLGFKIKILRPPHWVTGTLGILLLASLVGLFFNWQIGLLGLAFSVAGLWFAHIIGIELDLQTVGQVAEKMTRENYIKSRRNSKTFNKNEIDKILTEWFIKELDLDRSKLTRETKFA